MAEVFLRNPKAVGGQGNSVVVRDAAGEIEGVWDGTPIGVGINLNNLKIGGIYIQGTSANADVALNYPAEDVAGVLEILQYESPTTALVQRYTARDIGAIWVRYYNSTTWTAWAQVGAPSPPEMATGMVQMWAGTNTNVPAGWLVCNGAAVSRTTYADLWNLLNVTYGAGNGTSTFNLPDFNGLFPRGAILNSGGLGGSASHTHGLSTAVADIRSFGTGPSVQLRTRNSTSSRDLNRTISATSQADGGTSGSSAGVALTGDTDSDNTLPPYMNILYIIKT